MIIKLFYKNKAKCNIGIAVEIPKSRNSHPLNFLFSGLLNLGVRLKRNTIEANPLINER
jgi:hypothetical protein